MGIQFPCAQCGKMAEHPTGHVNRSRRLGLNLYCGRRCSGLGRRKGHTEAQKKEAKRFYDIEYRKKNANSIKARKKKYFQKTYDPAKAKVERKKRRARHAEYCRQPKYKAWKQQYDRHYRAKKTYGEFWECFLLYRDIEGEVLSQMTRAEVLYARGAAGKSQQRRRELCRNSI